MMKQTLLQIVQTILSSMDSDEVNSINDTVESYQVATILRQLFYDIAVDLDLREHESLLELNASGNTLRPVLMTLPTGVSGVDWIKYNNQRSHETKPNYVAVEFVPFEKFLERTQAYKDNNNAGVMSFTSDGGESFEVIYLTNEFPTFFSTVDGTTLLFNSYHSEEDSTLQKNKVMAFGNVYPTFTMLDSYVPDIDETQFSYFINKAKVRAFNELKQQVNQEAISESRRQKIVHQVRRDRTHGLSSFQRRTNYGRK